LHVIAPGAASVTVELDGATYSASPSGERFWLLLGVPVEASPGPRTIRATARNSAGGILGSSVVPLRYTPVTRPVDYLELTEEEGSVLTPEAGRLELSLRAAQFAQFDPGKRWGGYFLRPLPGFQTTAFGQARSINGGPIGAFHSGMDIAANLGESVRASAAGRVSWVGEMPIRGRSVIIDHGAGVKSGYHHLSEAFVSVGMQIEAGQVIAAAGSTGLSTGPHLHWEVTVWGINVDPLQWTAESFDP
jgi:murein DD-endopeptidase MepM/ murein hydrolase activator NlpD